MSDTHAQPILENEVRIDGYRICNFIRTQHRYTDSLSPEDVDLFSQFQRDQPRPSEIPNQPAEAESSRSQARSRRLDPNLAAQEFPPEWAVDKAAFRQAVREFKSQSEEYINWIRSGSTRSNMEETSPSNPESEIREQTSREESASQPRRQDEITVNDLAIQMGQMRNDMKAFQLFMQGAMSQNQGTRPPERPNRRVSGSPDHETGTDGENSKDFRLQELGFFDPHLDDAKFGKGGVVYSGSNTYIRNPYVFMDRIRDVASLRGEATVKSRIPQCLRGEALSWYTEALNKNEKDALKHLPGLDRWADALTERFQEPPGDALRAIADTEYSLQDAKHRRPISRHVHSIMRHAKAAGVTEPFAQLNYAWKGIDCTLRATIPPPEPTTVVAEYIRRLEKQGSNWYDIATRALTAKQPPPRIASSSSNQGLRNYSGPIATQSFDTYRPPGAYGAREPYYRSQPSYTPRRNYQNMGAQRRVSFREPTQQGPGSLGNASSTSNPSRTSSSNEVHSPSNSSTYSQGRYTNSVRRDRWRPPRHQAAHLVDPDEEDWDHDESQDPFQQAFDEGVQYALQTYSLDPAKTSEDQPCEGEKDETNTETSRQSDYSVISNLSIANTPTRNFRCNNCHAVYPSNTKLHKHLREHVCKPSMSHKQESTQEGAEHDPATVEVVSTIVSTSTPLADGQEFRRWHYTTCDASLSDQGALERICPDSGSGITIVDRSFMERQGVTPALHPLENPIRVRGVGGKNKEANEWCMVKIRIPGVLPSGRKAMATFQCEAHIVDGLEANLLLGTGVAASQGFHLDFATTTLHIAQCQGLKAKLYIEAKDHARIKRKVLAQGKTEIPARTVLSVPVKLKSARTVPDRDFIFNPDLQQSRFGQGGGVYTQIADAQISHVQVYNASSVPCTIDNKTRLGYLMEFDEQAAEPVHQSYHHFAAENNPWIRVSKSNNQALRLRCLQDGTVIDPEALTTRA